MKPVRQQQESRDQRRLIISKTENREGMIYEVREDGGSYMLNVELSNHKETWLGLLPVISEWVLNFESASERTLARFRPSKKLEINFFWATGVSKGRVREASLSIISKAVVEDESGVVIGWIDYGFRKDRIFLEGKREIGFVRRLSRKGLPWILPPSKAHWIDRFEFVHERVPEFDERLLFAYVARRVYMDKTAD